MTGHIAAKTQSNDLARYLYALQKQNGQVAQPSRFVQVVQQAIAIYSPVD